MTKNLIHDEIHSRYTAAIIFNHRLVKANGMFPATTPETIEDEVMSETSCCPLV